MKGAKNMSEIQNAIEVKNLKKGFGGRVLFENFSLNVKANTIHAIIGPNGSGKTTLLRLITGVYQPNAGTINIAGKYAMELENDYLYEEQTGLENLRIFGKYFGFEINDRSDSYCTQLGLTEHLGKRVSTYSKGMKRKLSLLIVIMMGRDILLIADCRKTRNGGGVSRAQTAVEHKKDGRCFSSVLFMQFQSNQSPTPGFRTLPTFHRCATCCAAARRSSGDS